MKCIVKPSSPSMLVLDHGEVVEAYRPSVVTATAFVNSRLASGMLVLVAADIPDAATDEDFRKFWKDSDRDEALAVQSFLSKVKPGVTEVPEVAKDEVKPLKTKK